MGIRKLTRCDKRIIRISVTEKIMYVFVKIKVVAFKVVIPIRYSVRMPIFFLVHKSFVKFFCCYSFRSLSNLVFISSMVTKCFIIFIFVYK